MIAPKEVRWLGEPGSRPRRAPFGASWSEMRDARNAQNAAGCYAVSIAAEASSSLDSQVQESARALPDPSTLPEGSIVIAVAKDRGWFAKVLSRERAPFRAVASSALLVRGYTSVSAAQDDAGNDLVWGEARRNNTAAPSTRVASGEATSSEV